MLKKQYIGSIEQFNSVVLKTANILICGAATFYKLLVDYLADNEYAGKIVGIIDINAGEGQFYNGIRIYEKTQFSEENIPVENILPIVAVDKWDKSKAISVLEDLGMSECLLSADPVAYAWRTRADTREKVKFSGLDFLVAGFPKCGTTSLHFALQRLESIYLPLQKETHFFEWCNEVEDPMRILAENFYEGIRSGQLAGAIEPTMNEQANQIYQTFGEKLKICLLMRNPANAEFSRFKMMNRLGVWRSMDRLYHEHGAYCKEMLDTHLNILEEPGALRWNYEYDRYLEDYNQYYPSSQIKVIIFEELISDPQEQINDFLEFVGSDEHYRENVLPHDNSGDFVWRTREGYDLAK